MIARRGMRIVALSAALFAWAVPVVAQEACAPEVSSVLDKQRMAMIAAQSDLADQNFSRRPGSFASTTCLENLMQGGGLDIFFKPPSLEGILSMVKNLACEQASQIFAGIVGGTGGIGGGLGAGLGAGEILPGINLGGTIVPFKVQAGGGSTVADASLRGLFR